MEKNLSYYTELIPDLKVERRRPNKFMLNLRHSAGNTPVGCFNIKDTLLICQGISAAYGAIPNGSKGM